MGDKDASTVDATRELARLGSLIAVSHADKTAWNGRGLGSHVEDRVLPIQIKVVEVISLSIIDLSDPIRPVISGLPDPRGLS